MPRQCNGSCLEKFQGRKPALSSQTNFKNYHKCRPCKIFYPKGRFIHCPCCGCKLATRPKSKRRKFLENVARVS